MNRNEINRTIDSSISQNGSGGITGNGLKTVLHAISDNVAIQDDVYTKSQADERFVANTPSGDPMHYTYISAGAVWNNTTKYWELNGLTDITNEQMSIIFHDTYNLFATERDLEGRLLGRKCRTNMPFSTYLSSLARLKCSWTDAFRAMQQLEVLNLSVLDESYLWKPTSMVSSFNGDTKLRKITGIINFDSIINGLTHTFAFCEALEEVKIVKLHTSLPITYSRNISLQSIKYMIDNSNATSPITITLHPDAYNRIANDDTIIASLTAKPNVSLASA